MKIKIQLKNIYNYFYLVLALIGVFWVISLFELYLTFANGLKTYSFIIALVYKFLNDFWAGLLIGLLLFPFYWVATLVLKKYGNILIHILFVLIVLVQFTLVKYSITTLLNLGADLLGYSFKDASMTVNSSEVFSFLYFFPFLLFPILYLGMNYIFIKFVNKRQILAIIIVLVVFFGSLKLVVSEASEAIYQNKIYYMAADIVRYQKEQNLANSYNLSNRSDYPLLKPFKETKDVLSPFFNIQEEKPNIVVLIVEGLGSEFVGKNDYRGFTPYLDSLISKSLYWENFVSTSSRSFNLMPSLFGSLPYAEKGFLELNPIPSHISLISVLKANGYTTSFYSGHQSSFDRVLNFLEYNGIDDVIDENTFGGEYIKTKADTKGYSWGYPDEEIFNKTLSSLDGKKQPRLDIVMTLTNHEPFDFPLKENYLVKVDSMINSNQRFGMPKEELQAHSDIFASLLYVDNSIKDFMNTYAEREEHNNTIFIITGDHRLIPIIQKDKLCKFHVPFYIYSPMLKKAEKFKSVSSHLDVTPSLLSFLMNNYKFNKLEETAWISQGIDTFKQFRNIHNIPLMRYKGFLNDFIYKDYFYSDGELYKINEDFGTYKIKDENLMKIISDSLIAFKKLNVYLTKENKIFPDSLNIYTIPAVKFSNEENLTIKNLTKGLNFDQIFNIAKEKAFNKEYKKARLLCDYILNELPNHVDVRMLKGRTFAWEKNYEKAEVEFLNVLKRTPYYYDGYIALEDLYWWSNQDEKSIAIAKKATENGIYNPEISFKLAKAYQRLNNMESATKIMDSILKLYPVNEEYLTFKNSLK